MNWYELAFRIVMIIISWFFIKKNLEDEYYGLASLWIITLSFNISAVSTILPMV